jgi:mannose-1-phosphate guanylyltransferase
VHLYKRYPESTVAVFPSDHFVLEEELFMSYVDLAFRVIEKDPSRVVLLGIRPSQPEAEYGYILPGRELKSLGRAVAREVSQFIEKPEPSLGQELILNGGLWNTMVMVFKAQTLLRWVAKLAPLLHNAFTKILDGVGTPAAADVIKDVYTHLKPVNFSHGLLESLSAQRPCPVLVLPVHGVYWSDWGSEERIVRVLRTARYAERRNPVHATDLLQFGGSGSREHGFIPSRERNGDH